jgi:hypothetical protein
MKQTQRIALCIFLALMILIELDILALFKITLDEVAMCPDSGMEEGDRPWWSGFGRWWVVGMCQLHPNTTPAHTWHTMFATLRQSMHTPLNSTTSELVAMYGAATLMNIFFPCTLMSQTIDAMLSSINSKETILAYIDAICGFCIFAVHLIGWIVLASAALIVHIPSAIVHDIGLMPSGIQQLMAAISGLGALTALLALTFLRGKIKTN